MSNAPFTPGQTITMAHGSGGKAMHQLIESLFVATFDDPQLSQLEDQARFYFAEMTGAGDRLAFTTDSYVVDPLFFPGGDIGQLAVTGTVNDLAVGGARPLYLSCGMIIEEGLPIETLQAVAQSMKRSAETAGVSIVTGDTKVVPRGACDKLFINTAGVGVIPAGIQIEAGGAKPGDAILINGYLGDHGAAIVDARGELAMESQIETDCQPLNHLIADMLAVCPDIRCLRDATRGGLATVLNEFAAAGNCCMQIEEQALPIRTEVRGICEILGLDPLYLANEGKLVAVVPAQAVDALLDLMRAHPAGAHSAAIGCVAGAPAGRVLIKTAFGSQRIVDTLIGEQLPRIC
ncbi:hydrogenase expression/formation protein HypE [Exilibacterium tricleocarpae]|uniref:Hydrogenase expression/formation protein HypE n=1 Tax=Exilibacterium tricleocarpae TaxID=2591008 RepID=A0A545TFM6_9GAMM|nr:hydrogenase expression/formation protein HypE [Exilibacterium tricleocarpae]TQV75981.1 hydrogenase expression/formation protein HypE [Exilibacterium tricleocarpae]